MLLGPETFTADALPKAQRAAGQALALRHPAVVSLLAVRPFGERIAWVYEAVDGLGLGHTLGQGEDALLSTRAVAEVIARVAEIFVEIGPDAFTHPGPEPTDLLLDARGVLRIAGFASPFPRSPAMRAPLGDEGEPALVYRLGVLLAQLVSGSTPGLASDRGGHASMIRRALIRAMSRPGPVLSERYGDWLRGLLAWDPSERPALSTVPDGLRVVAEGTAGEGLVTWTAANVDRLRERVEEAAAERRGGGEGTVLGRGAHQRARKGDEADPEILARRVAVPPSLPPFDVREAFPETDDDTIADDPTQEAGREPEPEVADSKPPIRVTSLLPIPVQVGPPPEAVRSRPSLPPGFLDEHTDPELPVSRLDNRWFNPRALWTAGILLGLVAVVLLAVNLFLWSRSAARESDSGEASHSIADVLGDPQGGASGQVAGDGFQVVVVGPAGADLTVDCRGHRATGVGRVVVPDATRGACDVGAEVGGTKQSARIDVIGPTTLVCFENGAQGCR